MNKLLPEQCVHLTRGELKHLHNAGIKIEITLEITTELEAVQPDYLYVTAPDRMKLCALCTGRVAGYLSRSEFTGGIEG